MGDNLPRSFHNRHAAGEGRSAAAGHANVTERPRMADQGANARWFYAELLGCHHAQRSAQAANVRRSRNQVESTVLVELKLDSGLAANIDPETGGDAAPLVGPERCRPVRMGFRG